MSDPKGHQATSPAEMPPRAWKDILGRTYKRTWGDNVGLVAAGVVFYSFFALLSLLAMIVLIYGLAADPSTIVETIRALVRILPDDVAALIATSSCSPSNRRRARRASGCWSPSGSRCTAAPTAPPRC